MPSSLYRRTHSSVPPSTKGGFGPQYSLGLRLVITLLVAAVVLQLATGGIATMANATVFCASSTLTSTDLSITATGAHTATTCTYNGLVNFKFAFTDPGGASPITTASTSLTISGGSVAAGTTSALRVTCPTSDTIASRMAALIITVNGISFGKDALLLVSGTLPPASTVIITGNTFSLNTANSNSGLVDTVRIAAIAFEATSDLKLSSGSKILISTNTITMPAGGPAGSWHVDPIVVRSTAGMTLTGGSSVIVADNTITMAPAPAVQHVYVVWVTAATLSVSGASTVSVERTSTSWAMGGSLAASHGIFIVADTMVASGGSTIRIHENSIHVTNDGYQHNYMLFFDLKTSFTMTAGADGTIAMTNNRLSGRIVGSGATDDCFYGFHLQGHTDTRADGIGGKLLIEGNLVDGLELQSIAPIYVMLIETIQINSVNGGLISCSGNNYSRLTFLSGISSPYLIFNYAVTTITASNAGTLRVNDNTFDVTASALINGVQMVHIGGGQPLTFDTNARGYVEGNTLTLQGLISSISFVSLSGSQVSCMTNSAISMSHNDVLVLADFNTVDGFRVTTGGTLTIASRSFIAANDNTVDVTNVAGMVVRSNYVSRLFGAYGGGSTIVGPQGVMEVSGNTFKVANIKAQTSSLIQFAEVPISLYADSFLRAADNVITMTAGHTSAVLGGIVFHSAVAVYGANATIILTGNAITFVSTTTTARSLCIGVPILLSASFSLSTATPFSGVDVVLDDNGMSVTAAVGAAALPSGLGSSCAFVNLGDMQGINSVSIRRNVVADAAATGSGFVAGTLDLVANSGGAGVGAALLITDNTLSCGAVAPLKRIAGAFMTVTTEMSLGVSTTVTATNNTIGKNCHATTGADYWLLDAPTATSPAATVIGSGSTAYACGNSMFGVVERYPQRLFRPLSIGMLAYKTERCFVQTESTSLSRSRNSPSASVSHTLTHTVSHSVGSPSLTASPTWTSTTSATHSVSPSPSPSLSLTRSGSVTQTTSGSTSLTLSSTSSISQSTTPTQNTTASSSLHLSARTASGSNTMNGTETIEGDVTLTLLPSLSDSSSVDSDSDADGGSRGGASNSELICLHVLAAISNSRYPFIVARVLDVVLPTVVAIRRNRRGEVEENPSEDVPSVVIDALNEGLLGDPAAAKAEGASSLLAFPDATPLLLPTVLDSPTASMRVADRNGFGGYTQSRVSSMGSSSSSFARASSLEEVGADGGSVGALSSANGSHAVGSPPSRSSSTTTASGPESSWSDSSSDDDSLTDGSTVSL